MIRRKKAKRRRKKIDLLRASRDLSKLEFEIIEFVWRWKVAPNSLVKEVLMKHKTEWQAYKIIRKLKLDGILEEIPKSKFINHRLLCVTELGFDIFLAHRDFIEKFRFRVHAPAHDYLATALQLSCLLKKTDANIKVFSEQELQTLPKKALPENLQIELSSSNTFGNFCHFPDDVTSFVSGDRELNIGYEVEINLKPEERYKKMNLFYTSIIFDCVKVEWVVILTRAPWIAKKIHGSLSNDDGNRRYFPKISYVLIDEFIKLGSDSEIFAGDFKSQSLRKVHENLWQTLGNSVEKMGKVSDWDIFFPKRKSPMKSGKSVECSQLSLELTPHSSVTSDADEQKIKEAEL